MTIKTPSDFGRALRAGPFVWPGGYPVFFLCSDGEALSFEDARKHGATICHAIRERDRSGWRVVAAEVNWEDGDLYSAHSGQKIEAAYL